MPAPRTILIVEDDLPFAEFLRAAIESLGHRAVHVASGDEAFAAFKKHQPDLVFLDLLLPKRDGFKIAEEIRGHVTGATVPIAMMTGIYRKAVYEKEGREKVRAAEYLIKPFGVREIWRVLERHAGVGATRVPDDVATPATRGTSLTDSPLACQLTAHLDKQSDGVLFVRGDEGTFVIYLRKGGPIFARSSNPGDRLDRVLVQAERATEAQVAEALQAATESRGRLRLGEALVERGILSREEMTTALQLQQRLILNRAFQVEAGHCLFVAGEHPTEEDVLLAANPREIILRGARMTAVEAARGWLPSGASLVSRPTGWESLLAGLNLRDDEAKLLQLADGSTSVERFLASAGVAGLDGPRILLGLCCAGLMKATTSDALPEYPGVSEWDATAWRTRPLGAVIAELHRSRVTGRLVVSPSSPASVTIHWRAGAIVCVQSSRAENRLGPMLEHMQLLDATTLETTYLDIGDDASDTSLARALVDRGLLGPAELYWAAVYQAHGAVHSLLEMGTLPFEWTSGATEAPLSLPDVPTIELAWNGIRSLDSMVARELLPERIGRLVAVDGDLSVLPLTDTEVAFARRLTDGVDVADLLASKDGDAQRTALGLCWLGSAAIITTPGPALPLSDDLDASGDFLDMLADDAFAEDGDSAAVSDSAFLESRLNPRGGDPEEHSPATRIPSSVAELGPSAAIDLAALTASITLLARRLNDLRPTVRTLRGGLDGAETRVLVDRARMAELFDGLLEAIAATSQVEDFLERWQGDDAESGALKDEQSPVGVGK